MPCPLLHALVCVCVCVCVWWLLSIQVVLKGPSIKHRRATAELAAAQQQQQFVLAQQQQQQFGSPRSQGTLTETAYPQFPPLTASTGAVQGPPGSAIYPGVAPLQGLAPDNSQLPYAGSSIDSQQQQRAGSRPSTNGSGGSRRSSRAASRSSSRGYSSGSRAAGGEAGAAEGLPLQLMQGSGDGGSAHAYGGWPQMPDSARLQQQQGSGGGGYDAGYGMPAASTAPSLSAAWGDPGSQAVPAEQQSLSAAQRFRQARTNQVVPIPEEYLGGPAKIG